MRRDEGCLDLDTLARLQAGSLAAAEAEPARAHLARCAACQAEMELLRSFLAAEPATAEEAADLKFVEARLENPAAARADRLAWWQRFVALPVAPRWAASLALVLLVAAGALQLRQLRAPVLEEPGISGGVLRSASLALTGPKGDVAALPGEFAWSAVEGAAVYRVEMTEVDGTPFWAGEATSASMIPPAALAARVLPRKTLLWQVTARDAAGKVLAKSTMERFRLTP